MPSRGSKWFVLVGVAVVAAFAVLVVSLFANFDSWRPLEYSIVTTRADDLTADLPPPGEPVFVVTHLPTPEPVKAVYLTSWMAGTPGRRDELVKLIEDTELNAMVIDIKDYTGRIAFAVDDPVLVESGAVEERIRDIKEFIGALHDRGIYVIGRISVFQDVFLSNQRPDLAVRSASGGRIWRDRKGLAWLEPGAAEVWDYTARLGRAAYTVGFDELNFDYIRFPSDGNIADINYKFFDPQSETKVEIIKKFFAYLNQELADLNVPLSVDLFGLTATAFDDLGIGQILVAAAPYFDYIAPMVYPSHFASGFLNFHNPAEHPYEVVKHSMTEASRRLITIATSTPARPLLGGIAKLRPWLQDFDLGADYTAELVRAQIKATYDSGLTSWMLWDPANHYTRAALDKQNGL